MEFKRTKDKLAIVGYAPGRGETPFDDETFDIALMNDLHLQGNWGGREVRWDLLFDMHHPEVMRTFSRGKSAHWEVLRKTKKPVITLSKIKDIPASISYPIEEIVKAYNSKYFTSTVSYQLAWALYMGYKEVHVYGVNFIGKEEYEYQRASAEFWIGYLRGAGVDVYIPPSSCLMKAAFLYGYETHVLNESVSTNLNDTLRDKFAGIQSSHMQKRLDLAKTEGQMDAMAWFIDVFGHIARGGYIPPPENSKPQTAYEQQNLDRKQQAMNHFKNIAKDAILKPTQENATRLEAAAAALLSLPDDIDKVAEIDNG